MLAYCRPTRSNQYYIWPETVVANAATLSFCDSWILDGMCRHWFGRWCCCAWSCTSLPFCTSARGVMMSTMMSLQSQKTFCHWMLKGHLCSARFRCKSSRHNFKTFAWCRCYRPTKSWGSLIRCLGTSRRTPHSTMSDWIYSLDHWPLAHGGTFGSVCDTSCRL